jgi:hypothetical protein
LDRSRFSISTSTSLFLPKFMPMFSNYSVIIRFAGTPPMIFAATFALLFWSSVNLRRSLSLALDDTIDLPESFLYTFITGAATRQALRFFELKRDLIWILFWSL